MALMTGLNVEQHEERPVSLLDFLKFLYLFFFNSNGQYMLINMQIKKYLKPMKPYKLN